MNIRRIKNFDECIRELKNSYDWAIRTAEACQKKLAEYEKDVEIMEAKQLAEQYRKRSLLQLTDIEVQRIEQFRQRHWRSCKNGRTYRYEISGVGFGTVLKIQCPTCGVEEDVTDMDAW